MCASSFYSSRPPRRDDTLVQSPRGPQTTSNEDPEIDSSPASSSSVLDDISESPWMCVDDNYRYKPEPPKNPLKVINEYVKNYDDQHCRELREDINFLMVVAGLFLAIVCTFAVQTYPLLQEDKQDIMIRLLNSTNAQQNPIPPTPFAPEEYVILVNQLYLTSIALSLVAVVAGAFCLQWISAFSGGSDLNYKPKTPDKWLALRQLRFEGVVGWGVHHAPDLLLFLVQISIALFTVGLIYFFWKINHRVTLPALVIVGGTGTLLSLANFMPFLQSFPGVTFRLCQFPFKSPASWLVKNLCLLIIFIPLLLLNKFYTIEPLLEKLRKLRNDFSWKKHDEAWANSQGESGGCSLKNYTGLGFFAAVKGISYETDNINTILQSVEILKESFEGYRDWQIYSYADKKLSKDEQGLLDSSFRVVNVPPHWNMSAKDKLKLSLRIKDDFITALTLQYLARDNRSLADILFNQRVELYIRLKNSCRFIEAWPPSREPNFGTSLLCPIESHDDAVKLNQELKLQFLRCVLGLIEHRRAEDLDILGAATIAMTEDGFRFDLQDHGHKMGTVSGHAKSETKFSPPKGDKQISTDPADEKKGSTTSQAFEALCFEMRMQLYKAEPGDFRMDLAVFNDMKSSLGIFGRQKDGFPQDLMRKAIVE